MRAIHRQADGLIGRSIPVALLSCDHCGRTFTRPKKRGRYPATCSDECKAARGTHAGLRLSRQASSGTGTTDLRTDGARHPDDDLELVIDTVTGGTGEGWLTASEYEPVTDESGNYVRDEEGRVITRFRNYFGEGNLILDVPEDGPAVIGQADMPANWQQRLDAGESVESVRMGDWLGLPITEWSDGQL